jgi:PEP-CTERM motif
MKLHLIAAAAIAAATLPAQAVLIDNAGALAAPTSVIDFEAFDGFQTTGPEALDANVTFSGDAGSELGAFVRDLGDNGAWGVGNHFAASGFIGELRFTFSGLSSGAGAFVNHYALDAFPGLAVVVTAYGDNNQIIETHTLNIDTAFDSYNEGLFVGITRSSADIRSLSFKGVGVVVDDFAYTAPVPEPETYALMLAGLGMVGWLARRRKQS